MPKAGDSLSIMKEKLKNFQFMTGAIRKRILQGRKPGVLGIGEDVASLKKTSGFDRSEKVMFVDSETGAIFNIPAEQADAFKKDFPTAKRR